MARKPKFDYFDAFQRQADIACKEADVLVSVIETFTDAEAVLARLPEAHELEHRGDEVNHSIYEAIATDFITPIERDDILNMAQSMDEVIDSIEDIIQLFYMMDIHFMHKDALEGAQLIKQSVECLREVMPEFANFKKSSKFKELCVQINSYEEDADNLFVRQMRNLHTIDRDNPMRVLVWSRIFTKMEKTSDACEHVADIMSTVLLKNA